MGYSTGYLPGIQLHLAKKRLVEKASDGGLAGMRDFLSGRIDMHELEKRPRRGRNSRSRVFDRRNVFVLFLIQVLTGMVCGHVVKFMQGACAAKGKGRISSSSSAYCQGRSRLELPILRKIFRSITDFLRSRAFETWNGFKVMVVDGTGLDMPDTARNRKAYPPRGEKEKGTSFPQMNLVGVFELFSGGMIDWEAGNKHWGEQSLWKKLMGRIGIAGTIILGDCYYCSFGNIIRILRGSGHCIFPLERSVNMERLRRLGKGDCLVRLRKPSARAKSWTKKQWGKFPAFIDLRLIERTIAVPGFKAKKLRLLTTLLDHNAYPADDIVNLQRRRWDAELRFRDIKTAMGMNHLSCKTPSMIEKEITMFMTAYNLVRSMMCQAARRCGVQATRLSFSSAVAQMEEWMRIIILRRPSVSRAKFMDMFLDNLAENINPFRPGRSEPRVVKRTDQRFPKMKHPRKTYDTYRKAA